MYLQEINVSGFGILSHCQISNLSPNLNVIYGTNGSGKTTIVNFLRGVLCGFDDARQVKLLPPVKSDLAGGSLTLKNSSGRFEVIRRPRADQSDTLAISLLEGTANDVASVRAAIEKMPEHRFSMLYAAIGYKAHDLSGLVQFAHDEAIDLSSRTNGGEWISEKLHKLESEKSQLHEPASQSSPIHALEEQKERIKDELAAARLAQRKQLLQWQLDLQTLRDQIDELTTLGPWQDQELHAVECDLSETQDRLWSTREHLIEETEIIQVPVAIPAVDWTAPIKAIDGEIAHIQQVLRDLAASRMSLSVTKADHAGSEIPDLFSLLERQRDSISQIENQTTQISTILANLQAASECRCETLPEQLQTHIEQIREQVWLICQELGRQQTAHQQTLLETQREGVDRCEHELTRQIQRLRARRDELMRKGERTHGDRVHLRHLHDANGCRCEGHESASTQHAVPVSSHSTAEKTVTHTRTVQVSSARPGDVELESYLINRRHYWRAQRATTTRQLLAARTELQQLILAAREFSCDHTTQTLHNEYVAIEQKISDTREQWQSLSLLQTVLKRTQKHLNAEIVSPVVAEASRLLNLITVGRHPRMKWNAAKDELLIVDANNEALPATALSRGTLEQSVLCFRLALCREFQRRGTEWPLILDDVLTDSDEGRLQAAAEVLIEFAETHQILLLSCQEHLVKFFKEAGANLVQLTKSPGLASRTLSPVVNTSSSPATVTEGFSSPPQATTSRPVLNQTEDSHWLQVASPISSVPSLGEQMSRRLGALGVRSVSELVELDPEKVEMPLDSLQIAVATLRNWQNEARLLCCVPTLTGRDAQMLASCGISTPEELAACDANALYDLIADLRSRHATDYTMSWLIRTEWPTLLHIEQWITAAKSARTWVDACNWSAGRKVQLKDSAGRGKPRAISTPCLSDPTTRVHLHTHENDEELPSENSKEWKFYLHQDSPIVDAPSIGPRMAERLNAIGIETVSDLLSQIPADVSHRLKRREVTPETVLAWQQQANLVCSVPQLRGHDAQVLVACRIVAPEALASMSANKLFAIVSPFVNSREGARLLRSSRVPDLEEVTDWIHFAQHARPLKAA
ncbi:DUF4332 domain-containing protein [Planctomicrobium sp. SH668]|uniref:DUF4332 domain-containing protein n=1 Tax=Planctomicrobium sp. SH668 TaxID=3448126 RepID=UPI003F5BC273